MTRQRHNTPDAAATEHGFSLIEVLVALSVLSIAGVAFIRVAQSHIDRIDRLEVRMLADIVAQNTLVEIRLAPARIRGSPGMRSAMSRCPSEKRGRNSIGAPKARTAWTLGRF